MRCSLATHCNEPPAEQDTAEVWQCEPLALQCWTWAEWCPAGSGAWTAHEGAKAPCCTGNVCAFVQQCSSHRLSSGTQSRKKAHSRRCCMLCKRPPCTCESICSARSCHLQQSNGIVLLCLDPLSVLACSCHHWHAGPVHSAGRQPAAPDCAAVGDTACWPGGHGLHQPPERRFSWFPVSTSHTEAGLTLCAKT